MNSAGVALGDGARLGRMRRSSGGSGITTGLRTVAGGSARRGPRRGAARHPTREQVRVSGCRGRR
jgi:hypothetical protein